MTVQRMMNVRDFDGASSVEVVPSWLSEGVLTSTSLTDEACEEGVWKVILVGGTGELCCSSTPLDPSHRSYIYALRSLYLHCAWTHGEEGQQPRSALARTHASLRLRALGRRGLRGRATTEPSPAERPRGPPNARVRSPCSHSTSPGMTTCPHNGGQVVLPTMLRAQSQM